MEHDGVPDDTAYWPAMPCEMHTPGPRRTLPGALGFGAVPRPRFAEGKGGEWEGEREGGGEGEGVEGGRGRGRETCG